MKYLSICTCRNRTELTPENLKHLENVFRENLAKDKEEFTLAEFKKIVPSKNVSSHFVHSFNPSSEYCHVAIRVSVQGVKSLGGHFACLCRGFEFYEVKKNVIIFQKENGNT